MRRFLLPLWAHLLLLGIFAVVMVCIWMIPVWLAGYPNDIPTLLLSARNFWEGGVFSLTDALGRYLVPELLRTNGSISADGGRLSAIIFGWIGSFVPYTDLIGWSLVTSILMALCLFPLWIAIRSFFDVRVAWITVVIFALMPIYWREAIFANNYQIALFFLFISFASYGILRRRTLLAVAVAGLFFGLAVSAKDTFLVFVPWYVIATLWFCWPTWKKGLLIIAVFGLCSLVPYLAPYVGDIRTLGYPMNQNLARVWPGGEKIENEIYLHLYPDPYTYYFDRERFDRELLVRLQALSALERLQYQKILLNFDLAPGIGTSLLNGAWLFVGSIPSYFQQDTMGGAFLWLFILPGIVLLWRKNKRFAIAILGLLISTELCIRFVLHFNREHLMDVGWALALFAGIGMANIAEGLTRSWKKITATMLITAIVLVVAAQLVQANRTRFARIYAKVLVQDTVASASALRALPESIIVASPWPSSRLTQLALLSDRSVVLFSEETIGRLLEKGILPEVFAQYEVTHIFGYPDVLARSMRRVMPSLQIIADPKVGPKSPTVTPGLRWLLHFVR